MEPYDSDDELESNYEDESTYDYDSDSESEYDSESDNYENDSEIKPWKPSGAAPFETKKIELKYLSVLDEEPWGDEDMDFFFSSDIKCLLKK